jgi:lipoate-protein ligase B
MKVVDLGTGVDYAEGLRLQEATVEAVFDGREEETLFLLEHAPVYTIGRLRDQSSLRSRDSLPFPVFEISRGGQATYHGPGQLVGYPIVDLRTRGRDLHAHLRHLEDALIRTCQRSQATLGIIIPFSAVCGASSRKRVEDISNYEWSQCEAARGGDGKLVLIPYGSGI